MNLSEFLQSSKRLILVMNRPRMQEISLVLRITLLGVAVVGAIGYMVRVIFWFVNLAP